MWALHIGSTKAEYPYSLKKKVIPLRVESKSLVKVLALSSVRTSLGSPAPQGDAGARGQMDVHMYV